MRAIIFSGGTVRDFDFVKETVKIDDFLIGADSGASHIAKIGRIPDVLVGDMDSIGEEPFGREIIRLNVMKDETDTEAAVRLAIEKGADRIVIIGATGTRIDHSLANILLLKQLYDKKIDAVICDERNEVRYTEESFEICGSRGELLSLIPLTRTLVERTEGLLYELKHEYLEFGTSRGVSNVLTAKRAAVKLVSGALLVIKSRD